MIKIYHPTRLMRQPLFLPLINYLTSHEEVTLRQLKAAFPDHAKLDRDLDSFITAGFIRRHQRRYTNAFDLFEVGQVVSQDAPVFVVADSPADKALQKLCFDSQLTNKTNAVILAEQVDFPRENLTLSSYFYRLQQGLPTSPAQAPLYDLLGDLNYDYAMKYMTSFLLKFVRKSSVPQKRPDIFVQALVILGYIEEIEPQRYALTMDLDVENLRFTASNQ